MIKYDVALTDGSSDKNLLSSKIESNSSGKSQGTKTALKQTLPLLTWVNSGKSVKPLKGSMKFVFCSVGHMKKSKVTENKRLKK